MWHLLLIEGILLQQSQVKLLIVFPEADHLFYNALPSCGEKFLIELVFFNEVVCYSDQSVGEMFSRRH